MLTRRGKDPGTHLQQEEIASIIITSIIRAEFDTQKTNKPTDNFFEYKLLICTGPGLSLVLIED